MACFLHTPLMRPSYFPHTRLVLSTNPARPVLCTIRRPSRRTSHDTQTSHLKLRRVSFGTAPYRLAQGRFLSAEVVPDDLHQSVPRAKAVARLEKTFIELDLLRPEYPSYSKV